MKTWLNYVYIYNVNYYDLTKVLRGYIIVSRFAYCVLLF
jgi:hypothetical protein